MNRKSQGINAKDDREDAGAESVPSQADESQRQENGGTSSASVDLQAELSHIQGSSISVAGGNVFNIRVDSVAQAQAVLKELSEHLEARRRPAPPSPDAPLQEKVDHWFQHELGYREKLFAITLSMFNGLNWDNFQDIYEIILEVMEDEEEDKKPPSPFHSPYEELVNRVEGETIWDGLEGYLKFKQDEYETAVFDLMRRRHPDVLRNLLPALKRIGEERYWPVRSRAAEAAAEIGKIGFHRLKRQVLVLWASDRRAHVRAAVGYAMARLAEDDDARPRVEDLLADWTDERWSGPGETWRYRWTAASTYKQIGSIEADWAKDWAYRGLKKVAGFDDIRLADAVIHSLVVISLQGQLERVLLTAKGWIEEGSAGSKDELAPRTRCIVGILAFMVLSEVHIELATEDKAEAEEAGAQVGNLFELVRQSEAEKGKVWQLVIAVGVRAFEFRLANAFFDLIARWTRYAADEPPLQNTVRNLLLDVFIEVRPHQREHILNCLNRWQQQTKDEHLAKMAASAKVRIKERVLGEPPRP
jgi:hypothetical protein